MNRSTATPARVISPIFLKPGGASGACVPILLACATLAGLSLPVNALAADLWALDVSGVWDVPNNQKIKWNPATGNIGNMGNAGVTYNIAAAPAAAQAGAAAAAGNAFQTWNLYGALPTVRIKFTSQAAAAGALIPLSWGNEASPGAATGAAPGYSPDPIILNQARTLRTDGWSLDLAGTRPGLIDEYDVYTTVIHEVGHPLGLGHPGSISQVMTPQNTARGAGGKWRAVEQVTPFVGQPLTLAGGAQANGALDYKNPRASFGFGDALGAITLYSAPIAKITSLFTAAGAGGGGDYSYTVDNLSAFGNIDGMDVRAGYQTHAISIPVAASISVYDLIAPAGWSIQRESDAVLVSYIGGEGLLPGESLSFSFSSDMAPTQSAPNMRWRIEGLGGCAAATDDDRGCATPDFDTSDFGVLDGTYTYAFDQNADGWVMTPLSMVLAPVPETQTYFLMLTGLGLLGLFARRRH